jgi:hypothetical protein
MDGWYRMTLDDVLYRIFGAHLVSCLIYVVILVILGLILYLINAFLQMH